MASRSDNASPCTMVLRSVLLVKKAKGEETDDRGLSALSRARHTSCRDATRSPLHRYAGPSASRGRLAVDLRSRRLRQRQPISVRAAEARICGSLAQSESVGGDPRRAHTV